MKKLLASFLALGLLALPATAGQLRLSPLGVTTVVIQEFTADGTYTPTSGMVYCIVEAVGAGGGGGGVVSSTASTINGAGGGGSGSYSRSVLTAAQVGTSLAVDIGALGTGGTAGNNNGVAGAATTLGSTIVVANGGSGGTGAAAGGGAAGGAAGTLGTGTMRVVGQIGATGATSSIITTSPRVFGGEGGRSFFSPGARSVISSAGAAATGYGGGGGGASSVNADGDKAGGNGAPGYIVITEFVR